MHITLLVIQIIISTVLISIILIQGRGTGFGRGLSSGSSASFTRRGLEKLVFRFTFIMAAVFITISILQVAL